MFSRTQLPRSCSIDPVASVSSSSNSRTGSSATGAASPTSSCLPDLLTTPNPSSATMPSTAITARNDFPLTGRSLESDRRLTHGFVGDLRLSG